MACKFEIPPIMGTKSCYPRNFHKTVTSYTVKCLIGSDRVLELARQRSLYGKILYGINTNIYIRLFKLISIDYLKLDKCKEVYRYALMIWDHFKDLPKYLELKLIKQKGC